MRKDKKAGKAYSPKEAEELVEKYTNGFTVEQLAVHFNKTPKSIISKLSLEGVYEKKGYRTKRGEIPEMKSSMVSTIETTLGERYFQLDKLPKPTLDKLRNDIVFMYNDYHQLKLEVESLKEDKEILKEQIKGIKK